MPKFVKLTLRDNELVWINSLFISHIYAEEGHSVLCLKDVTIKGGSYLVVKESPNVITNRLKETI